MKLGKLGDKQYNWISAICAVVSLIFMVITICKANTHAPIYGLEKFTYYDLETKKIEELNNKLSSGKYTLLYFRDLNINEPGFGDMHVVMLGKVKK